MCYPSLTASVLCAVFLQCGCAQPSALHPMTLLYLCINASICFSPLPSCSNLLGYNEPTLLIIMFCTTFLAADTPLCPAPTRQFIAPHCLFQLGNVIFACLETGASWIRVEAKQSHATSATSCHADVWGEMPPPLQTRQHALPDTFMELTTRSSLLISLAGPEDGSHHKTLLAVAVHPMGESANAATVGVPSATATPLALTEKSNTHILVFEPTINFDNKRKERLAHCSAMRSCCGSFSRA